MKKGIAALGLTGGIILGFMVGWNLACRGAASVINSDRGLNVALKFARLRYPYHKIQVVNKGTHYEVAYVMVNPDDDTQYTLDSYICKSTKELNELASHISMYARAREHRSTDIFSEKTIAHQRGELV